MSAINNICRNLNATMSDIIDCGEKIQDITDESFRILCKNMIIETDHEEMENNDLLEIIMVILQEDQSKRKIITEYCTPEVGNFILTGAPCRYVLNEFMSFEEHNGQILIENKYFNK